MYSNAQYGVSFTINKNRNSEQREKAREKNKQNGKE